MEDKFRRVKETDGIQVIDIFNYYIENSFAAYLDTKLSYDTFEPLRGLAQGYPFYVIENERDGVIGFGFMGKYHPSQAFNQVAELTYFLSPLHINRGLGTKLLNILIAEAKELGVETLLASINSLNPSSVNFHLVNGFKECGRFIGIGRKQGTNFDVIWMQKFI
ncbi:MAG TPA: GNAT family N-acetyltransferase [Syntrophomonadaceae bacterium]|nr:GNAT family N-acetyltransferase [Syntrophomonadaceae bacterium]